MRRLVVALVALHAGSAAAFFDVQVTGGKRFYRMNSGANEAQFSAEEFDFAAHLSPFAGVPVAFGLGAGVIKPDEDEFGADDAQGTLAGLDVTAWIPFVPVFVPFARLTLPFYGHLATESRDGATGRRTETDYRVTGYRLGAGLKYSLLPVLDLLVEGGMAHEKIEPTEVRVDGKKDDTLKGGAVSLKSNALTVGVQMGL